MGLELSTTDSVGKSESISRRTNTLLVFLRNLLTIKKHIE